MSKGGYQLLDYRDICDESISTIYNGYSGTFEIPRDTQAFIIAKNAVTCGKPIILNNIQDNDAYTEITNNFYMYAKVYKSLDTKEITDYMAQGFAVVFGDPTFIDINYNIINDSVRITVNIMSW